MLGRTPNPAVRFGNLDSEVPAGCEFVEMMARDIGVEIELFGYFACGHAVGILVDVQIDVSSGDVAKCRGYCRDRRGELCRAEVLGIHTAILRIYDRHRSRSD